jgi:hypothetical protein
LAAIRITIGAVVDPSMARAFVPLEQAAAKAQAKVRGGAQRAGRDQTAIAEAAAAKQAAAAERKAQAVIRADQKATTALTRAEAALTAQAERQAQRRVAIAQREFDARLRASKKARSEEEREILRAGQGRDVRGRFAGGGAEASTTRRTAREFGHRSVSNLGQAARFGMGVAGDFARGAGVDLSLGNAVGRNVELEKRATELSNSGWNPNADAGDAARVRVEPEKIQSAVKEAADANKVGRVETMSGLQAFVGKTGDLRAGMALMKELGGLAKATGTDMGDMINAAGDAFTALEGIKDPEDRLKRTASVMRVIAGQGKLGAVEIADLASQMAKLGANATAFEGNADDNVAMMGAFAQMSRKKGGSASATQAATSVASLVNTFKTPARIKAFKAEGIDVMNDAGMIRNPQQLMMAALSKTRGDPERFKKMFANVQGARAVEGFATTYRQARGEARKSGASDDAADAAGLRAVSEEFERLKKVAMGEGEIRDSLNRRLANSDSKVQEWQNRLDDVAGELQGKLTPALERAAPGLVKLADATATVVAWAAENPGKAITAALVMSIGKAGVETAVGRGLAMLLERATSRVAPALPAGGAASGKPGAPGVGGMGTLGSALAIGTAAVAITSVGMLAIDSVMDEKDKEGDAARSEEMQLFNQERLMKRIAKGGPVSERDKAELSNRASSLNSRIEMAKGVDGGAGEWLYRNIRGEGAEYEGYQKDAENLDALQAELAAVKDAMQQVTAKLGSELQVRVTNQPGPGGPGVDPSGRTPGAAPPR